MKNSFSKSTRFINLIKFVKFTGIALFSLIASVGFSQSGTILINGSGVPVSSATKFPIWLPGGSGQSINIGTNVTSISGILYNLTSSAAGGNIMTVNSVVYITGLTSIAAGTALKVEGILFATTSSSTSSTWNIGGNTPGGASVLGSNDNSPVSIQSGTGALNIGQGATTGAINIGGTTQTGGINIGTGTGVQTTNIGSANDLTAIGGNETIAGTMGVTGASTLTALTQTGTTNMNTSGTAATNIGTSSNTGPVSIGNSTNSVALPAFTTAGVVHNAVTTGKLSSSLVNLTSGGDVTGTLPVGNGGTGDAVLTTNGVLFGNGTAAVGTTAQGSAGTVLHGNGGTPSFSAVNLTSDVGSSVLPVANGGTGSTSENFVDLSNAQTVGGAKTWSNAATFNGSMIMQNLTTYVKSYNNSTSTPITYSIARDWFDEANWGFAGVLVEEFSYYPAYGNIDCGMYMAIYSYGSTGAGVTTKMSSTAPVPAWAAHVSVGGTIYYRDLQITVPAYNYVTVRMTTAMPVTTNFSNTTQNYVYFY